MTQKKCHCENTNSFHNGIFVFILQVEIAEIATIDTLYIS